MQAKRMGYNRMVGMIIYALSRISEIPPIENRQLIFLGNKVLQWIPESPIKSPAMLK